MIDISQIEATYRQFVDSIDERTMEQCVEVNLDVFSELGLLHEDSDEEVAAPNQHFNMIESTEKITLFNREFLVWITPQPTSDPNHTIVMVALNQTDTAKLELILSFSGVYNSSKLVLKVLNRYLEEIRENESLLQKLAEPS